MPDESISICLKGKQPLLRQIYNNNNSVLECQNCYMVYMSRILKYYQYSCTRGTYGLSGTSKCNHYGYCYSDHTENEITKLSYMERGFSSDYTMPTFRL